MAALAEEVLTSLRTTESFNAEKGLKGGVKNSLRLGASQAAPTMRDFTARGNRQASLKCHLSGFIHNECVFSPRVLSAPFAKVIAIVGFGAVVPVEARSEAASASAFMSEAIDQTAHHGILMTCLLEGLRILVWHLYIFLLLLLLVT